MKLNYSLSELDFLNYHMYASSKSKIQIKKRRRNRLIIPLFYVFFGLFLIWANKNLGFLFLGFALLWYLIYPKYSKWYHKKHFEKHIKENHKNRVNKPVEIEFFEDHFTSKDAASESTTKTSELDELIEVDDYFYIKLVSGLSFIIPKSAVKDGEDFKNMIVNTYTVEYINEVNYKWQ